jgi:potassium-transporting ATPase potassium-binding subunit
MTVNGWIQISFFGICVLLVAKPLGLYLVRVYDGSLGWLRPVERIMYRICGVDPSEDQHWTRYAGAMLIFSAVSMLLTYVVLRLQDRLPLNPQVPLAVSPERSVGSAIIRIRPAVQESVLASRLVAVQGATLEQRDGALELRVGG